jgi:hypothetical protein
MAKTKMGGSKCRRRGPKNKPKYDAYRNNATREKNKAYRIIRYLENNPEDAFAQIALENIPEYCVKAARKLLAERRAETQKALEKKNERR